MPSFVCFVGASTVEGLGDPDALGWPGRLRRIEHSRDLIFYNLGVRGHSSAMIAERWQKECDARLPDSASSIVAISFGNNDVAEREDGSTRIPFLETIEISTDVVARCAAWQRTLWIGPTPVDESRMPFYSRLLQCNLFYRNTRLSALNSEFTAAAARLNVPYLDLFNGLVTDKNYMKIIGATDGLHPDGTGYDTIAAKVAAWSAWRDAVAPATTQIPSAQP